jgi:hypothetical protein
MSESSQVGALLPQQQALPARMTPDNLRALPAVPAVMLLSDDRGSPVFLARTQNLRRLLGARLVESPTEARTRRADLSEVAREVRWQTVHSAFEARWRYLLAARVVYPRDYRRQLDFGPAWFLHVDWSRAIPEMAVTERIWSVPGEFCGP